MVCMSVQTLKHRWYVKKNEVVNVEIKTLLLNSVLIEISCVLDEVQHFDRDTNGCLIRIWHSSAFIHWYVKRY